MTRGIWRFLRLMTMRSFGIALFLSFLSVSSFLGQADKTPAPPAFDVISVRPSAGGDGGGIALRADGLYAQNVPLRFMVDAAFNHEFSAERMVNLPPWAMTDTFDVAAKVAEADVPKLHNVKGEQSIAVRSQLTLAILTQRFAFRYHTELRQGQIYELVIAKGGPKIKPSAADPPAEYLAPDGEHVVMGLTAIRGKITGHVESMARLVRALQSAGQVGRVVIDHTGLAGNYDFALNWAPEMPTADAASPDSNLPSLFTALQEQLGLRLQPATGPINTLVINHVEKPTPN